MGASEDSAGRDLGRREASPDEECFRTQRENEKTSPQWAGVLSAVIDREPQGLTTNPDALQKQKGGAATRPYDPIRATPIEKHRDSPDFVGVATDSPIPRAGQYHGPWRRPQG